MDETASIDSFLKDNVRIILVEPQHSGNIGATLRAMNNTGLRDLFIVNASGFDIQQARWMAPGCEHLFPHIRFCSNLSQALTGVHHAVGATARHRRSNHRILQPKALASEVLSRDSNQVTAILFGREDSGLSANALRVCEAILWIPTAEHASLNLSQAIMVTAYALFTQACQQGLTAQGRSLRGRGAPTSTATLHERASTQNAATLPEMEPAILDFVNLLERVGYSKKVSLEKIVLTLRQLLQRSHPTRRHVQSLRGMAARIHWALSHPDLDWKNAKDDTRHS